MNESSFARILKILDLFSLKSNTINVDLICQQLEISRPMSYRYLKELVNAGLLKKSPNSVGDYVLGTKVATLDYICRSTDPLIQLSIPVIDQIVERTNMLCLLTILDEFQCVDVYHAEYEKDEFIQKIYGRGHSRLLSVGGAGKLILSNLPKKTQLDFFQLYKDDATVQEFAQNTEEFVLLMRGVKKQGFYVARGENNMEYSSVSVPIKFSNREAPWALSVVMPNNRIEFANVMKLVNLLQKAALEIEHRAEFERE